MSQVLEKPILLDETGQEIAGKLDTNSAAIVNKLNDIKEAIGTSSEFIPVMIKVVTPPTKTLYNVGERLNLSGMVVNLVGTNGVQIDVTQACTFVPANNTVLTAANTSVAITYHYAADNIDFSTSQALTIRALDSITVTTPPIKTAYQTGETLDLTGIVVTATYSDGYTANVTPDCTFNPANGTVLSSSDTSVTITYTEGGTTETTTVAIGVKELLSIAVTHLPTKTSYKVGETLDLTGLVVTATYDDTSTLDVTNRCTFSPDDGDTLTVSDTSVDISYTEGSTTKTTSQTLVIVQLDSIAVTTPPTKLVYGIGDTLDLTGISVTATYDDSSTAVVTSSCVFNPANGATLSASDTSVSISYTEAGVTKTTTQALSMIGVYGVEWDGTATTAWTRTDSASNFTDPAPQYSDGNGGWTAGSSPFDSIQPWAGMQRVSDANAGELVSIPKFYYKFTKTGYAIKVQIVSGEFSTWALANGFSVSPAHRDRGDGEGERDVVYIGRYKCSTTNYKSVTGVKPKESVTRSTARTAVHNLGTDVWLNDFMMFVTIWLLYLVEFADWDSQEKIGGGGGTSDAVYAMGYTDGMTYHTGTTATSISRTVGGGTQYRNIEGLWDNKSEYIDGMYFAGKGTANNYMDVYGFVNPSNYNDTSGGTLLGEIDRQKTSQFTVMFASVITTFDITGFDWVLIPQREYPREGSEDSYITDIADYSNDGNTGPTNNTVLGTGSMVNVSARSGLFSIRSICKQSVSSYHVPRLMKLPNS